MWGAIIGAGISAASSLYSNHKNNKQSQANADKANAFTREMMQNKYQWQVDDMRKAGLNPILGVGNAAAGSSAMATAQPLDLAGAANSGANSGRVGALLGAELDKLQAEADQVEANTKNQNEITKAQVKNLEASTAKAKSETSKIDQDYRIGQTEEKFQQSGAGIIERATPLVENVTGKLVDWLSPSKKDDNKDDSSAKAQRDRADRRSRKHRRNRK